MALLESARARIRPIVREVRQRDLELSGRMAAMLNARSRDLVGKGHPRLAGFESHVADLFDAHKSRVQNRLDGRPRQLPARVQALVDRMKARIGRAAPGGVGVAVSTLTTDSFTAKDGKVTHVVYESLPPSVKGRVEEIAKRLNRHTRGMNGTVRLDGERVGFSIREAADGTRVLGLYTPKP